MSSHPSSFAASATPQVRPGPCAWFSGLGLVEPEKYAALCSKALSPFRPDSPLLGLVLTAFPSAGLAEKAVRVASAVWRRKCGLIIDLRLLSSNATSDPEGLKRKCRPKGFLAPRSHLLHVPVLPFQVAPLQYAIRSKCLLFCALFTALGSRVINLAQP